MLQKKIKIVVIEQSNKEFLKLEKAVSNEFLDSSMFLANTILEANTILNSTFPDIIILDLTITEFNGIEYLKTLKNNPKLNHIPVVILSDKDNNDKDVLICYKLGIAGYLLKTLHKEEYKLNINKLIKYWSLNEFIQF